MLELIVFCLITTPTDDCTPTVALPPCTYEDSLDCYWDAGARGNGMGQSFIDVDGITYNWTGTTHYNDTARKCALAEEHGDIITPTCQAIADRWNDRWGA